MYHAKIYLDTGNVIEFDCEDISCKKDSGTSFTSLSWTKASLALFSVNLNHVVAVCSEEIK